MDQYIGFIGNTPLIEDTDEQGNIVIKFMDVVPAKIGDYKQFINEKSVKRLIGAILHINSVSLEGKHTRAHTINVIGEYPNRCFTFRQSKLSVKLTQRQSKSYRATE